MPQDASRPPRSFVAGTFDAAGASDSAARSVSNLRPAAQPAVLRLAPVAAASGGWLGLSAGRPRSAEARRLPPGLGQLSTGQMLAFAALAGQVADYWQGRRTIPLIATLAALALAGLAELARAGRR
ncbi:MAG: hypothetical protein U0R70_16390 [Solirubrobacteraceae bacterium]